MKNRRAIIALICAVASPLRASAQDAQKVPRIGVLDFFPSAASGDFLEPFRKGLAERGYIDGRNIQVEYRSAEQSRDRAAEGLLQATYARRLTSSSPSQRLPHTELALQHGIPLIADQPSFARAGGLAAYGINRSWPFRRLAHYVDAVLKGAKPSAAGRDADPV